ncbi:hypothetical protein QL285_070161 [Trifolium repens]|nr:hypothetical protein QL285_070161 [Trifolium repens]
MNIQKEEIVEDSLELLMKGKEGEIVEDSFETIQEKEDSEEVQVSSRVPVSLRVPKNFDLNEDADYEFDLNKFPEEEEEEGESYRHIEIRRVIRKMLKIILPNYY